MKWFKQVFIYVAYLVFALLFGNLFITAALADETKAAAIMERFDLNRDGVVVTGEWQKSAQKFKRLDLNADGRLTEGELAVTFAGGGAKPFENSESQSVPSSLKDATRSFWDGPIIDPHSQIDERTDLDMLIALLDQSGVRRTILSTRFKQSSEDVIALERRYPQRIIAAAKTKTSAFMKGKARSAAIFEKELQRYQYRAMAEVIMWHAAKKGVGAGQAVVQPDDPRLEPLLRAARNNGWPFVAHVEFAAMGGGKSAYMHKFETFLQANSDLPVGLIHMGQLNSFEVERLLPTHPNLFFIMSHCNPVTNNKSRLPWTRMFSGTGLAPAWRSLVEQYPDRFVLAFDNVFHFQWEETFLPQVKIWRKALAELPDPVSHKLAHENAERIWKLSPFAGED